MRLLSLVGMNPTTIIKGGVIYEATPIGVVEQNGNALRTNEEKSDGWPTLDPAARHGLTGRFIEIIEPHTEADPVGLAIDFLVSFGSAVGPGPHAMADGSAHPARLNAILVGKTSKARKGTTRRQVARVFDRVDEVWARERTWGGLASGEGLIAAVAGESTDPRLLVVEEEISRPLAVAAREGSTLSAIIRQAWDTGNLRVMTRNQPLKASGAHVSILAHSTIEDIRRRLTESDVMNGFANRFLFGLVRRSKLLPSGGSVPEREPFFVRSHVANQAHRRQKGQPAQPIGGGRGVVEADLRRECRSRPRRAVRCGDGPGRSPDPPPVGGLCPD